MTQPSISSTQPSAPTEDQGKPYRSQAGCRPTWRTIISLREPESQDEGEGKPGTQGGTRNPGGRGPREPETRGGGDPNPRGTRRGGPNPRNPKPKRGGRGTAGPTPGEGPKARPGGNPRGGTRPEGPQGGARPGKPKTRGTREAPKPRRGRGGADGETQSGYVSADGESLCKAPQHGHSSPINQRRNIQAYSVP